MQWLEPQKLSVMVKVSKYSIKNAQARWNKFDFDDFILAIVDANKTAYYHEMAHTTEAVSMEYHKEYRAPLNAKQSLEMNQHCIDKRFVLEKKIVLKIEWIGWKVLAHWIVLSLLCFTVCFYLATVPHNNSFHSHLPISNLIYSPKNIKLFVNALVF